MSKPKMRAPTAKEEAKAPRVKGRTFWDTLLQAVDRTGKDAQSGHFCGDVTALAEYIERMPLTSRNDRLLLADWIRWVAEVHFEERRQGRPHFTPLLAEAAREVARRVNADWIKRERMPENERYEAFEEYRIQVAHEYGLGTDQITWSKVNNFLKNRHTRLKS
jgi:hypothetical protein